MNRHVGGREYTLKLLEMAELAPPSKIIDCGCGEGQTVELLKSLGYDAIGVDKIYGDDFLSLPFDDGSFDAVISECAFFASGNQQKAIDEAFRLLKPGGKLMIADVFEGDVPFECEYKEDITKEWTAYYLERLWLDDTVCDVPHKKGMIHYYLAVGRKQ